MKKVAFFVTGLDSGGLENYLLRFLRFSEGKIDATVICKGNRTGVLEEEFSKISKIKPMRLGFFNVGDYYRLYKYLKAGKFETVCDFTGNFAALPLLSAKYAGISTRIVFYRGSSNHFPETPLRLAYNKFLNKLIPRVSSHILSNSKAAFEFFFYNKWKESSKYQVIYNGIDIGAFLSPSKNLRDELKLDNKYVIGHVGRYNSAKNHSTILKVASLLCKEDKNISFLLCGEGVAENLTPKIAPEIKGQILLLGYNKDISRVLNTANCFYFPSVTEGQPNALIEAMMVGLPFVSSKIESIKETVPGEYHEFLTDPNDVDAAVSLLRDIKDEKVIFDTENLQRLVKILYNADIQFNKFHQLINS